MLAAPLLGGMALARWRPELAIRFRKPLALFGASLLATVIILGTYDMLPRLLPGWRLILIPVILHNGLAFAAGLLAGKIIGASPAQRRALVFEVGIQNCRACRRLSCLRRSQGIGGAAAIAAAMGRLALRYPAG